MSAASAARASLAASLGTLASLLAFVAVGLTPGPTSAQEDPEPPMAEAPPQFRVGGAGGVLEWPSSSEVAPEDGSTWGLDLEHLLLPAVSIRLGAAYGTTTLRSPDDAVAADAYLADLTGVVRAAFDPLERIGVIPFATLGAGTLVHDPDRDGLATVSQNVLGWGAGLEVRPLATVDDAALAPVGVRAEWRRYQAELENVFDPVDRAGRTRHANRFFATLFWAL